MFLFHVFKAISLCFKCKVPALLSGNVNTIEYVDVVSCASHTYMLVLAMADEPGKRLWLPLYEIPLLLFECVNGISISINKCHKWFAWVWLEGWRGGRRLV